MDYLLDTHTFLWMLNDDEKLSPNVLNILLDVEKTKYVSAVSFWEVAIKVSIGKLTINHSLADLSHLTFKPSFHLLCVDDRHALEVANLTPHHKDPFDRLLIAQAQIENLILLTKDSNIRLYDVSTLW